MRKKRVRDIHTNKDGIKILESLKDLPVGQQKAVDFALISFYLGGQSLKDVYFLKNAQIEKDRVWFIRHKVNRREYEYDVRIFDKCKLLLDKYNSGKEFVFPWRKDETGYNTTSRNLSRNLAKVVAKYDIPVLPREKKFTHHCIRHTFSTIGRELQLDKDIKHYIMGHELEGMDEVYSGIFPQEIRDDLHLKIIET